MKYHQHMLIYYLINVFFFFKIEKMLLPLLPLGLRDRSSARVAWISLLKSTLYLLWCGKSACWPSKRRWLCHPRWHNAIEDEKSLRLWAWRVEHLGLSSCSRDTSNAPGKQATSPKYTAQSQETLGNETGFWSQMEKGKKSETSRWLHLLSGPLSTV